MTEWTVQVLDEKGNVKYQSNTTGTEEQAKSLVETFEKKYREDVEQRDLDNAVNTAERSKRGFY
ncbi:hypothetical protein [Candidatus Enterococcus ferrettii]|uniref:Uncharacterized protein n=1 Tax=Candidatus Enterococcus ferrettii TaxID=2815324 RepID=A0ABV0EI35_9ENTE|nr:hypothetical protein [Enterococcus sp. 665A]MBO1341862.1 hypothetical protein [Enterococcus sp. 665A]